MNMKNYTTPYIKISIFSDLTETSDNVTSNVVPYVNGLKDIDAANKTQVKLNETAEITKFVFSYN